MRWNWIDRIVRFEPERRLVAVKNVSAAEEHLHDHFPAEAGRPASAVMPASLIIEGMAQAAGLLAGSAHGFREKVILAKITSARLDDEAIPGDQLVYDAVLERVDAAGASAVGTVRLRRPVREGEIEEIEIGEISLLFSHVDANRSGLEFPQENFVFSENFRSIIAAAGLGHLVAATAGRSAG